MLTADQLRQFKAIHRHEFDRFDYVPDPVKWQTPEHWISRQEVAAMACGRASGDCEDIAAIVRARCRELGIPTRLVFCWVPPANGQPGGYHIGVEADGWFSDCNHPYLIERDLVPYVWISVSGFEAGDAWHFVAGFDPAQPWPHEAALQAKGS